MSLLLFSCQRCQCNTKKDSNKGAKHGKPLDQPEIDKLPNYTKEEMEQAKKTQKLLNEGLWLRAALMKGSKDDVVYISCPLKYLSPLFAANMYMPTRSIMSLSLSMRDDSQILCVSSSDTNKYKIEVKDIYLKLKYATYHDQVKERWESAIDANGLRRNVQCDRTSYFVMKQGSASARFQSIFSFSVTPCVLICYFLTEKTFIGNFSANRYSFQDPGVKSIQIFIEKL